MKYIYTSKKKNKIKKELEFSQTNCDVEGVAYTNNDLKFQFGNPTPEQLDFMSDLHMDTIWECVNVQFIKPNIIKFDLAVDPEYHGEISVLQRCWDFNKRQDPTTYTYRFDLGIEATKMIHKSMKERNKVIL